MFYVMFSLFVIQRKTIVPRVDIQVFFLIKELKKTLYLFVESFSFFTRLFF
jgi:hypothetical protein